MLCFIPNNAAGSFLLESPVKMTIFHSWQKLENHHTIHNNYYTPWLLTYLLKIDGCMLIFTVLIYIFFPPSGPVEIWAVIHPSQCRVQPLLSGTEFASTSQQCLGGLDYFTNVYLEGVSFATVRLVIFKRGKTQHISRKIIDSKVTGLPSRVSTHFLMDLKDGSLSVVHSPKLT